MVIYKLENLKNGFVYIGQTVKTVNRRASQHISKLKSGSHGNARLQNDFNDSGVNSFTFQEIEKAESLDLLDSLERYWIKEYLSKGTSLYNIESGGRKGKTCKSKLKGIKLSADHVKALKLSKKGKDYSRVSYQNAPKVAVLALNTLTNESREFATIRECAKAIDASFSGVRLHMERNSKLLKNKWFVRAIASRG